MNSKKFSLMTREFPFLREALQKVEPAKAEWTHKSLGSVRVCRADNNLLESTGFSRSYSNAAGYSSWNYTVYVAVWRKNIRKIESAGSDTTGGGHDDRHWSAARVGDQLRGETPDFILEVYRSEDCHSVYREVTIHKVRGNVLNEWTREQLHRAADELADELEAAT